MKADTDECKMQPAPCAWHAGANYYRERSTLWRSQTQLEFEGAKQDGRGYTIRGEESIKSENLTHPSLPIVISENYTPEAEGKNMLGLGAGSSLLNRLYTDGLIPSRTWSLDMGWAGEVEEETWTSGELVLGGVDHDRYAGSTFGQDFSKKNDGGVDRECHLKVMMTGLKITKEGQQVKDLLGSGPKMYGLTTLMSKLWDCVLIGC